MRKILMVGVVAVMAVGLGGCPREGGSLLPSVNIGTQVTVNTMRDVVGAYGIALAAANSYRSACLAGLAGTYATCRDNVRAMQPYNRQATVAITAANTFIKRYPTLDASNAIGAARDAVASFQSVVKAKGG